MRIGVMMGGISSERDISLKSGANIIENLDKNQYTVIPIEIDNKEDVIKKVRDVDFVLLALHGSFGEDGSVQAVLDCLGVPYSGCDALSSRICMDKNITKKILITENINTARWVIVDSLKNVDYEAIDNIGYPVFVKPNSGGSSVATSFVNNKEELDKAIELALIYDKEVMIEEYIKGDEITCPVFNGKTFPIISIKPTGNFFDKQSKYSEGGATEQLADYDKETTKKIEDMALKTYKALKCSVYARVDMIVKDGIPYILEVNTLPGMTKNSLVPKSAEAMNISYSELLDFIIELSLKK